MGLGGFFGRFGQNLKGRFVEPFRTPGFNPNARRYEDDGPDLPVMPERPPMPVSSGGFEPSTARGSLPAPELPDRSQVPLPPLPGRRDSTPYSPMNAARYDYVMQGAKRDPEGNLAEGGKIGRSWKDILGGAGIGFLRGLGSGGGLAAGLGGAVGGAAIPAINPTLGREAMFNAVQAPRMQADLQQQQQTAEAERQAQLQNAQLRNINSQIEDRDLDRDLKRDALKLKPPPAPPRPVSVAPGATLVNPQTGQAIFTAPGRAQNQKPPTLQEAEADRAAEEGSPEQIATDSTEARREEIMAKMPAKYRQILQQGFYEEDVPAVDADGNPIPGKIERRKSQPDANEAEAAQRMFDREYDRLYKQNLSYTQGVARQKAAQRRTQARSQGASTGPSGPRAKLSDVKKLLTPQR